MGVVDSSIRLSFGNEPSLPLQDAVGVTMPATAP
jgi:hypothetical protein